jgi:hypothetical protein
MVFLNNVFCYYKFCLIFYVVCYNVYCYSTFMISFSFLCFNCIFFNYYLRSIKNYIFPFLKLSWRNTMIWSLFFNTFRNPYKFNCLTKDSIFLCRKFFGKTYYTSACLFFMISSGSSQVIIYEYLPSLIKLIILRIFS